MHPVLQLGTYTRSQQARQLFALINTTIICQKKKREEAMYNAGDESAYLHVSRQAHAKLGSLVFCITLFGTVLHTKKGISLYSTK